MFILIAILVFAVGLYLCIKIKNETIVTIISFITAFLVVVILIFSPFFARFAPDENVVISQETATYELVPFDITAYCENSFAEGSCYVLMFGEIYTFCRETNQNGSIEPVFEAVSLENVSIHEVDGVSPKIVETTTIIKHIPNIFWKIWCFPIPATTIEETTQYDIYVACTYNSQSNLESSG